MAHGAVLAASLLIFTMSCKGAESCAANNPMTVAGIVDGQAYCGEVENAFTSMGNLNVASSNSASTISVNFGVGAMVGVLTVGQNVPLSFQLETSSGTWTAAEGVGSGTLTVVTLTPTTATGTFNFVGQPLAGANVRKGVADGSFNVAYSVKP